MNEECFIHRSELVKAIEGRLKVEEDDAIKSAELVLNLFGFEDRVIDNFLETQDRQIFYALEQAGFVRPETEEVTLPDSRAWRIHYWVLQKSAIKNALISTKSSIVEREKSIYDTIPKEWFFRNS